MSVEKLGARESLPIIMSKVLSEYPPLLTKGEAADALKVSRPKLNQIIKKGHIKMQDGMIPAGAVAKYIYG